MSRKKQLILVGMGIILLIGGLLSRRTIQQQAQKLAPKEELFLLRITPPPGVATFFNPTIGIQFIFDAPLATSSANIIISPYTPIVVETARANQNALIIRPKEAWRSKVQYRIIISKGMLSADNTKELKEKIEYEIVFEPPPQDIIQIPPPPR